MVRLAGVRGGGGWEVSPARIAAAWWSAFLRGKPAPLDNGDRESGLATVIGMLAQAHEPKPDEVAAQAFEDALCAAFEAPGFYGTVGVDYHPDRVLSDAAQKAGVKLSMVTLPWKTCMWIKPDRVTVRCGYGAATQVLWEATAVSP